MPPAVAFGLLAAVLVVAAYTDVRHGKVYNWLTYPAVAIALAGHGVGGGLAGTVESMGLWASLAGLAAGFGPMLVMWLAGGLGGGDAKLMGAVGALAGWRFALAAMFYGFAIAALMAIFVLLRKRVFRKTMARIGRFLLLTFTPAKGADPATAESPKVPFGLALCIGSGLALIEAIVRGPGAVKLILGI